jgi:hypothetical protein
VPVRRQGGRRPQLAGVVLERVRGDDGDLHRMRATGRRFEDTEGLPSRLGLAPRG